MQRWIIPIENKNLNKKYKLQHVLISVDVRGIPLSDSITRETLSE